MQREAGEFPPSRNMESPQNPAALAQTARPKLPPGRNRKLGAGEEIALLSRPAPMGA